MDKVVSGATCVEIMDTIDTMDSEIVHNLSSSAIKSSSPPQMPPLLCSFKPLVDYPIRSSVMLNQRRMSELKSCPFPIDSRLARPKMFLSFQLH
jgi:hypothetical protein